MKRTLVALTLILLTVSADAADPVSLRLLSYNVHHGEGVDGKLDLARIAKVIRSVQPDLVALQEVDQNVQRSESVDQPAELARLTEMHVAFGANIDLQGGHYGNAVLSRFPIAKAENQLLPNVDNGEQRGVLVSEITVPQLDRPLLLLATHFDHRGKSDERIMSAKFMNNLIAQNPRPAVLMGDLNAVIGSETLERLDTVWKRTNDEAMPTIPVGQPRHQIDFVLVHPPQQWKVIETRVLDEAIASDHRAIFSVVEFRAE